MTHKARDIIITLYGSVFNCFTLVPEVFCLRCRLFLKQNRTLILKRKEENHYVTILIFGFQDFALTISLTGWTNWILYSTLKMKDFKPIDLGFRKVSSYWMTRIHKTRKGKHMGRYKADLKKGTMGQQMFTSCFNL